jgi:hypothetical protein
LKQRLMAAEPDKVLISVRPWVTVKESRESLAMSDRALREK